MRVMFFQYGDFSEAFVRFREGGPEKYRDQRRSVKYVEELSSRFEVTVLSISNRAEDVALSQSLRCISIDERLLKSFNAKEVLEKVKPDFLVCRTPHYKILRAARKKNIPTLPSFADIFETHGLKSLVRNFRMRKSISGKNVPCVLNHNLNASESVATSLFYPRDKIVPWDWSRVKGNDVPKLRVVNPEAPTAFFAGMLTSEKGVEDCLMAVKILRERGVRFSMTFAGPGDVEFWIERAKSFGVDKYVNFLGPISNSEVMLMMREHDFVIVPSRHSYAEGLANTIYEGLASRSPLIISDHPAFLGRLKDRETCLFFQASNPESLVSSVKSLIDNPDVYMKLSVNSAAALDALFLGREWTELVDLFLNDPLDRTGWVSENSLSVYLTQSGKNN